tara:strand:- start:29 stop:295 length:267 start_codon:yes stop_codon:yes gene_type:complete
MPGIARNGQDVAGGVAIQGSSNVNVNSKGVVRLGDKVASHGLPPHSPTPPMVTSSTSVKVNGFGVVKAGDSASCGHTISGSSNVNAGA